MNDLRAHLQSRLPTLQGAWVHGKRTHYEADICRALGMTLDRSKTYWDAKWNDYLLEFKKGESIWINLGYQSQVLLDKAQGISRDVHYLFFIPHKKPNGRIRTIYCVDSNALLEKTKLTPRHARALLDMKNHFRPHRFDPQFSFNEADLKNMKLFSIG